MSAPHERDLIVGGQAVIEGVMMRTPHAYAVAVRRQDGTVRHTAAALPKWGTKFPALNLPVVRGSAVLAQSMALGIKALNYSAAEAFADDDVVEEKVVGVALTPAVIEGEGDFAGVTGAVPGLVPVPTLADDRTRRGATASAAGSIFFALFFNVMLFIVAPLVLTNALFVAAGWASPPAVETNQAGATGQQAPTDTAALTLDATHPARANEEAWYARLYHTGRGYLRPVRPSVAFNLVDGAIRLTFFLVMIFGFSLLKDIRRVFEYHGAEHKTVFTWEAGLPLTVEHARRQPRQHPRCGTSFLMVVMLVSIALFSVIKFDSLMYNLAVRVALLPVVAGLSYEIIRLSAKREGGIIFKLITLPGLWLQNITTKEPDDSQLEVAIFALKESLKLEPRAGEAVAAPLA